MADDGKDLVRWAWDSVPWEYDTRAQLVVSAHPDGLSHRQIAMIMGCSMQEVLHVEEQALCRLRGGTDVEREWLEGDCDWPAWEMDDEQAW